MQAVKSLYKRMPIDMDISANLTLIELFLGVEVKCVDWNQKLDQDVHTYTTFSKCQSSQNRVSFLMCFDKFRDTRI